MIAYDKSLFQRKSFVSHSSPEKDVIVGVKSAPQEAVDQFVEWGKSCGFLFNHKGDIVLLHEDKLLPLMKDGNLVAKAPYTLANYVIGQDKTKGSKGPLSQSLLWQAFHDHRLRQGLPTIDDVSDRPAYGSDFTLLQPGYHREQKLLVLGERIDPIPFNPETEDTVLHEFLGKLRGLPFKEDADYVNMVGVFLMTLLARPLAPSGKMFVLLDGDCPGLGKTLLAQMLGLVADGKKPAPTEFTTGNEELSKRIASTLKTHKQQSVLLFDNARVKGKAKIDLTSLESLSSSPMISLRIIRTSNDLVMSNNYTWILTMNDTKTTRDLADRGLFIRLSSERQRERQKKCQSNCYGELMPFVEKHHREIRDSLYGMIEYWKSLGRPEGTATHRFANAAKWISGILDSCGMPDFLSNHEEATRAFDPVMDDLCALFETTMEPETEVEDGTSYVPTLAMGAREWLPIVEKSQIARAELAAIKSMRGKLTHLGKRFNSDLIDKPFSIEVNGHNGTATLIKEALPHKQFGYRFYVTLDPEGDGETAVTGPDASV